MDEQHPRIEISGGWLFSLQTPHHDMRCDCYIPPGMQVMLDLTKCWPLTDIPRYFDAVFNIRVNKVIKRIYVITGHMPKSDTWVAQWPD